MSTPHPLAYLAISQRPTTKRSLPPLDPLLLACRRSDRSQCFYPRRDAIGMHNEILRPPQALRTRRKRAVGRSHESNSVLPHEVLAQRIPASAHARVARVYLARVPNPE